MPSFIPDNFSYFAVCCVWNGSFCFLLIIVSVLYFSAPIYFTLYVSLCLKWVSCKQHIIVTFFKPLWESLYFNWYICTIDIRSDYWYSWINAYHIHYIFYLFLWLSSTLFLSFVILVEHFIWFYFSPFLAYVIFFLLFVMVALDFVMYIYIQSKFSFK